MTVNFPVFRKCKNDHMKLYFIPICREFKQISMKCNKKKVILEKGQKVNVMKKKNLY